MEVGVLWAVAIPFCDYCEKHTDTVIHQIVWTWILIPSRTQQTPQPLNIKADMRYIEHMQQSKHSMFNPFDWLLQKKHEIIINSIVQFNEDVEKYNIGNSNGVRWIGEQNYMNNKLQL